MKELLEKYSDSIIDRLDKVNFNKIVMFLTNEECDYVEDLIEDYLDIFVIDYNEFVRKYNILNKKYNNKYLELVSEDMNLLEELFEDI